MGVVEWKNWERPLGYCHERNGKRINATTGAMNCFYGDSRDKGCQRQDADRKDRITLLFELAKAKREESALPSLPRNPEKRFPRPSSRSAGVAGLLRPCRIVGVPRERISDAPVRAGDPPPFFWLPPSLTVLAGRAGGQVGPARVPRRDGLAPLIGAKL